MTGRWPVRPADRPTRRETGSPIPRRHQPPPTKAARRAALARFDNRHSTSAPTPTLTASAAAAQGLFRAPTRATFVCGDKSSQKHRQKLRFCTSSARYTALVCKAAPPRNRHFLTRCRSADCASTAFRCRCPLLRQKTFVLLRRRLRNNYIRAQRAHLPLPPQGCKGAI